MKNNNILLKVISIIFILVSCQKDDDSRLTEGILGKVVLSQQEAFVNAPTTVLVHVTIQPGVELATDTISLKWILNGKEQYLGTLYDNGNLDNYDEIKGDHVFSGEVTFVTNEVGEMDVIIVGEIKDENNDLISVQSTAAKFTVHEELNADDVKKVFDVKEQVEIVLNQHLQGNVGNAETAVQATLEWIKNHEHVETATMDGTTSIAIKYKSGLQGGVIVSLSDANGTLLTRGGFALDNNERAKTRTVPLTQQTTGTLEESFTHYLGKTSDEIGPNHIGNRNVFIYAPFEQEFAPNNERLDIIDILDHECGEFDVVSYTNQNATVEALKNMTSYGTIVLATHGSQGKAFATGEPVDTNAVVYKNSYKLLVKANKLEIWSNMVIGTTGKAEKKGKIYAVNANYISGLSGTFPNSLILNNSCESTKNSDLQNAFINKGAKTYLGYDKVVSSPFCKTIAKDVFETLVEDAKKTKDISNINQADPNLVSAVFQLKGATELAYPLNLLNGDFEDQLHGWTRAGDGRVVSRLGNLQAIQGNHMGIISSGLGFTTETGGIFQTFIVPSDKTSLQVKWNFLSEEFLEFINSGYQDRLEIVIKNEEGTEAILLSKNIDQLASDFGATENIPGSLVEVSPAIIFDQGDVYMTGTQESSFDITPYQGKCITLTIRCTDIGDSIYDTAILLDEIEIK